MAAATRFALFDLDGTITRRDSFLPWTLGLLRRHPLRYLRVPLLLGPLLSYAFGPRSRDSLRGEQRGELKGAVMHGLFAGLPRKAIDDWSREFAQHIVAHGTFHDAVEALRMHRLHGEEVVLLSASPDVYVPRIGEELGVNLTICTQALWNGERLDGHLAGPNRYGAEKTLVLQRLRADRPGLATIAYGNSPADVEHMRLCEQCVYVNAPPRLARQLNQPGIQHVQWRE
ncbi:MAG: HAD-IB family phosphatase [Nevskiaceae bacterium]|jgi:phosphatidylglycerophosphatase C|nr:HAD-IB family phosphatase [Nevskiaceae bacterium]